MIETIEIPDVKAESILDFDMALPVPVLGVQGEQEYFAYTRPQFAIVLKIFAHYRFFTIVYPRMILQIGKLSEQVDLLETALDKGKRAVKALGDHNDYVHGIVSDQHKALAATRRRQILTGVIAGGSGLIIGIAIGVVIGVFGV